MLWPGNKMLTLGLILELAVTTYAFTSSSDVDALYPEFTAYKEQRSPSMCGLTPQPTVLTARLPGSS